MQKFGVKGTRMCIQDSLQASELSGISDRTPFYIQVASEARDAQRDFSEHGLVGRLRSLDSTFLAVQT